jgi:hypothetical protein
MTTPRNSGNITSFFGKDGVMSSATNKRYPPELRERAVRMVAEVQHEYLSEWAAVESVADKLGIGKRRHCSTGSGERKPTPANDPA